MSRPYFVNPKDHAAIVKALQVRHSPLPGGLVLVPDARIPEGILYQPPSLFPFIMEQPKFEREDDKTYIRWTMRYYFGGW